MRVLGFVGSRWLGAFAVAALFTAGMASVSATSATAETRSGLVEPGQDELVETDGKPPLPCDPVDRAAEDTVDISLGHRTAPISASPPSLVAGAQRIAAYIVLDCPPSDSQWEAIRGASREAVVAPFTYLVTSLPGSVDDIAQLPGFRGFAPVEPVDRLSDALRVGTEAPWAVQDNGYLAVDVAFYSYVPLPEALSHLDALGAEVADRSGYLFGHRLWATMAPGSIDELASSGLAAFVAEMPPPSTTGNATAAAISNIDDTRTTYGLSGGGVKVGIWDGGPVLSTHQELTGRVVVREGTITSSHATHVAGTILASGVVAAAKGMAPQAGPIYSYWYSGGDTVTEMENSQATDGIVLSNHSWGTRVGWEYVDTNGDDVADTWIDYGESLFGAYSTTTRTWDELVEATKQIVVKASMNNRNDCNPANPADCDGVLAGDGIRYDTIPHRSNAKNIITVGAVNDDGSTITSFSGTGPVDDGRIKPDLVANGSDLYSTDDDANNDYATKSGTSMSTPTVSGAIALLVEQYRGLYGGNDPRPDVMKALLVNTASDLGRAGPDYVYGFGLLDALAAAESLSHGSTRLAFDSVTQGTADAYLVEVPAGQSELKVTMSWIDPPGVANSTNADIVNNLDLVLIDPSGTTHYPFTGPGTSYTAPATATGPNTIDTVEQVVVGSPVAGTWRVEAAGATVSTSSQSFALASSAALVGPPNDAFANATPLTFPVSGDVTANGRASTETGEDAAPAMCSLGTGNTMGKTAWYRLEGFPATNVTVDTVGSSFDTVLAVWEGTTLAGLNPITCNDDLDGTTRQSSTAFATSPGSTYYLQVGGYGANEGRLNLNLTSELPNDDLADAAVLVGDSGSVAGSNVGASGESGEVAASCRTDTQLNSVWWSWTPSTDGTAQIDTEGSSFDTTLAVYTGDTIGTLVEVPGGCDDDSGTGRLSAVTIDVTGGETYQVRVDGYNTLTGAITLNYDLTPSTSDPVGWLRVTSSPAVPATVLLDGVPANTWGLDWLEVPIGDYEVCFTDVPGFTTPGCATVTVTEGATTTHSGVFPQHGELNVTTNPPVPAAISIDGNVADGWGVSMRIPAGDYEICYADTPGYVAPGCETITITEATTTNVVGTYTPGASTPPTTGLLRVTTNPALPALITIDGNPAGEWGIEWVPIAPGTHDVCYTSVPGYTTPPCETITITEGATTPAEGAFDPLAEVRVQLNPVANVPITLNNIPRNQYGAWAWYPPQTYDVCAPGYTCQTTTPGAGTYTNITLEP